MKKEGIQTRNRKVSNKNKKSKKAAMFESYSDVTQHPSGDDNCGSFSLGPGTLLTYSNTPHLHPSASLQYTHHLNNGMMPTLVWNNNKWTPESWVYSGISTLACQLCVWICTYMCFYVGWLEFSIHCHCILVDIILIKFVCSQIKSL